MKQRLVLTLALALAATVAATPLAAFDFPDSAYQPGVYFKLGFGGAAVDASRLQYGLKLDRASRDERVPLPPVVALDFIGVGFTQLRLGGVPLTGASLRLSQADGAFEGPGLRFWNWGLHEWGMVGAAGVLGYVITLPSSPTPPNPDDVQTAPTVGCDDGSTIPPPVPPGTLGGGCI